MTRFGVPGQNIAPLSYADDRLSVVPMIDAPRAPTINDKKFPIWTEWRVNKNASSPDVEGDFWKLIRFDSNGDAKWIKLGANSLGGVLDFAVPAGTSPVYPDTSGEVTYTSSGGTITITGSTNTINFDLTGGSLGVDSFTVPNGTSPVVPDAGGAIDLAENAGIIITGGTNAIDFALDGAVVGQTITGDSGGALSPTAGNWNVLGLGDTTTSGSGSTLSILSPAVNTIIVDSTANYGSHQTIAAAITAASAGDIIFIRPGTYDEDLTVSKNLTFVGFNASSETAGPVVIQGKITLGAGITAKFDCLSFATDGDDAFESVASGGSFQLNNCRVSIETGVFCFDITDSSGPSIWARNCRFTGSGSAKFINYAASSSAFFERCSLSGLSSASSTISAGSVSLRWCIVNCIFTTSNAASLGAKYSQFGSTNTPYLNVTYLTTAGTGVSQIFYCQLYSGSASACSIGSGTTVEIVQSVVNSSATNILTGAGTMKYGSNVYTGSSTTTNVTTETAYTTV